MSPRTEAYLFAAANVAMFALDVAVVGASGAILLLLVAIYLAILALLWFVGRRP
jgi:predicted tellurium resistance membrane protein TerC